MKKKVIYLKVMTFVQKRSTKIRSSLTLVSQVTWGLPGIRVGAVGNCSLVQV